MQYDRKGNNVALRIELLFVIALGLQFYINNQSFKLLILIDVQINRLPGD